MSSIWTRLINFAGPIVGILTVTNGGTGVATLASNGVLYGNGTGAVQVLAVNSTATNKFLTQSSSGAPAWNTIAAADVPVATTSANGGITLKSPTLQTFTTGSGTYTTPAGVLWLRVVVVGGGGGGAGAQNTGTVNAATDGGNSTFGSSFLTASGGTHGLRAGAGGDGGAGGAGTLAAGAVGIARTGSSGGTASASNSGALGGASPLGGVGQPGGGSGTGGAGNSIANTGSGGSGGTSVTSANNTSGGGGGSGGYVDVIIAAPGASYAYAVGAKGNGGSVASGNAVVGGDGGSGYILVEEHYY